MSEVEMIQQLKSLRLHDNNVNNTTNATNATNVVKITSCNDYQFYKIKASMLDKYDVSYTSTIYVQK